MRTFKVMGFVLALAVVACSGASESIPDATSGSGGAGGQVAAGFALMPVANGMVHRGESAALAIEVAREHGFTAQVEIDVTGLPPGVSAQAPKLGSNDSKGILQITADSTAALGAAVLTITARGAGFSHSTTVELLVAGAPGSLDTTFGVAGKAAFGNDARAANIAVQRDGRGLFAGGMAKPVPLQSGGCSPTARPIRASAAVV